MKVYDSVSGILRNSADVIAADLLLQMKKTNSSPWPVIDKIFELWASKHPKSWKSYIVRISDIKRTRKESKYASTYDKVHGGYLRYTLDIPEKVMYMIRAVYSPEELPMNRDFFISFSKKFPKFKIAGKL